jgi:hypothetical protein
MHSKDSGQSLKKDFAWGLTKDAVYELFFTGFPYKSQQFALSPRIGTGMKGHRNSELHHCRTGSVRTL